MGVKEGGCAAIPDSFVVDYIKSHNDNKPISEVDLDIELHKWLGSKYSVGHRPSYQIKTAPDNTVIVLSHNQSFREESSLETELKEEIKNLSEALQDMVNEFNVVADAKNEIEQEFAMNNAIELLKKYKQD